MAKPHFIESLKETLKQFKDEHRTIAKAVHDVESMLASMLNTQPAKRRGRPPGSTAAAPKRGRPPGKAKAGKAKAGKAKASKTGKKRGRPPGSKNKKPAARKAKAGGRVWTPEQKRAAAERLAAARAAKQRGREDEAGEP